MLARINRLSKTNDIVRVFKRGRFFKDSFLILKFFKNQLPVSRFAFVVSTKISKKASERNKIKRRLREAIRVNLKDIKPGFDAVLRPDTAIMKEKYGRIKEIVLKLLEKSKIL